MAEHQPTYTFGVTQRRNVLFGGGAERLVAYAVAGALVGTLILAKAPFVLVIFVGVIAAAAVFVPVAGRTAPEWALPLARSTALAPKTAKPFVAPVPSPKARSGAPAGRPASGTSGRALTRPGGARREAEKAAAAPQARELPPELKGFTWRSVDDGGIRRGVVVTKGRAGQTTLTALWHVRGSDRFALADPKDQARLIATWGGILAATTVERTRVVDLQWVERSTPDIGEEQQRWIASHRPAVANERFAAYEAMALLATTRSVHHDVYVAAKIRTNATKEATQLAEAMTEWRLIESRLRGAGFSVAPVSLGQLGGLLRSFCDPVHALLRQARDGGQMHPKAAGPRARKAGWDYLQVDGSYQRYLVVTQWPRLPVPGDWMHPLLVAQAAGVVRCVSMHLRPIPSSKALRAATAQRVKTETDLDERAAKGFIVTAARRREVDEVGRREEELTAGYGEHALACVIGITAASKEELDQATTSLRQAAAAARLDVEPLYSYQTEGFLATLPIAHVAWKGF